MKLDHNYQSINNNELVKNKKCSLKNVVLFLFVLLLCIFGVYHYFSNDNIHSNGINFNKNKFSLENKEHFLSRTKENNDYLYSKRMLSFNNNNYNNIGKAVSLNSISSSVSYSYSSSVSTSISSGDYITIRSIYGGLLYDTGSGTVAYGDYFGDNSLWLVGYSATYSGYYFQNVGTSNYLDGYGGDFTTNTYIDSFVCWTLSTSLCTDDGSATLYRQVYSKLQNVGNSYCPYIWNGATTNSCNDEATSCTEYSCDYCSSFFVYQKFN